MRRTFGAAVAFLAALALLPGTAAAAEFGSTDMTQVVTDGCPSYPCSVVNSVHADGRGDAGSPIDGILTSARVGYAGDGAGGVVRVLRDAGGGSFLNVGPEIPVMLAASAGEVTEVAARRPIAAGDRLALGADASFDGDALLAAGAPRECLRGGAHAEGDIQPYGACAAEVVLQGTVEPDADGDGYGDASQDGCPSDPVIHEGLCSANLELTAAVADESLTLFEPTELTFTVTNHGSSPAKAAGIKVAVGKSAQLLSAVSEAGRCAGVRAVFCWLGTMPAGATATVSVVLLPSDAGSMSVRSTVQSSTPDPNAGDNFATARAAVTDPFAGVLLRNGSVVVSDGLARIVPVCPAGTARFCQGDVSITQAATQGPRLGKGRFQLQAGASARVPVKLSKRAQRLLDKRRRIEVVLTARVVNGAGTRRTSYGRVVLVAPARTGNGR